jgi:hypothetical protein
MVLIKARRHTPGHQMVYVGLNSGRECAAPSANIAGLSVPLALGSVSAIARAPSNADTSREIT